MLPDFNLDWNQVVILIWEQVRDEDDSELWTFGLRRLNGGLPLLAIACAQKFKTYRLVSFIFVFTYVVEKRRRWQKVCNFSIKYKFETKLLLAP